MYRTLFFRCGPFPPLPAARAPPPRGRWAKPHARPHGSRPLGTRSSAASAPAPRVRPRAAVAPALPTCGGTRAPRGGTRGAWTTPTCLLRVARARPRALPCRGACRGAWAAADTGTPCAPAGSPGDPRPPLRRVGRGPRPLRLAAGDRRVWAWKAPTSSRRAGHRRCSGPGSWEVTVRPRTQLRRGAFAQMNAHVGGPGVPRAPGRVSPRPLHPRLCLTLTHRREDCGFATPGLSGRGWRPPAGGPRPADRARAGMTLRPPTRDAPAAGGAATGQRAGGRRAGLWPQEWPWRGCPRGTCGVARAEGPPPGAAGRSPGLALPRWRGGLMWPLKPFYKEP